MTATTVPNRKRYVRHWKERYTKGMPLIFVKRMKVNNRIVEAGEPVTAELREQIGEHRLRIWWKARRVGSATQAVVVGAGRDRAATPPGAESIRPVGGGWFEVTKADGTTERVRGLAKAKALIEE